MLSKRRQRRYFREKWDAVFVHLDQFAKHTNARDTHAVRVNLKKIRALLFLSQKIHGNLPDRELSATKKIFRLAGDIRNAQVSAHLLKSLGKKDRPFFTQQRNVVAEKARKLVDFINTDADVILRSNIAAWKSFRKISASELKSTVNNLEKKIKKVLRPAIRLKGLHGIRKQIKRLVYLYDMLPQKEAKRLKLSYSAYKKTESLIGKWHDGIITLDLLAKTKNADRNSVNTIRRRNAKLVQSIRSAYAGV